MDRPILTLLPATDLAKAAFPTPEAILAPILSRGSQCLMHGPPGVSKSLVALGIAHAVATGDSFLGWHAPRPHRVLYLDGYTAPGEMKRRLALFGPPPDSLQFSLMAHDTGPVRDLAALESQARLMAGWRRPELVVLDDLTSLAGPGSAAERWSTLRRFLLLQRRLERAVLLVQDVNREGRPDGPEYDDVLDVVLSLRRPADWQVQDGPRVEIHIEKARGLDGEMVAPIEAALRGGRWHWRYARPPQFQRGVALLESGLGAEAMGRRLGISRASAFRLQRQARQLGLVRPAGQVEP
ncbi:MAG TPA: AAA family ATPase [Reyranella sp.]|nr:AAA family ATPase [Reyranella sp.]